MLELLREWLESCLTKLSRKSDTTAAVRYALTLWDALVRYCDDGRLEVDNNAAERALRAVALGRKNYLLAGSDTGGERAAAIYSLIGSANSPAVSISPNHLFLSMQKEKWNIRALLLVRLLQRGGNMSSINPAHHDEGLTLRQAALIAGFSYLLMPVTFAEFYIYPKLVIRGNIEQTAQNIVAHGRLFAVAILCYLITLILDVVIAWALYVLLVPVNRSVSLLTAWFRLVYTVIALFGLLNLTTAYRLLHTPDYLTAFGSGQLHAQVMLLLNSYRYDWSMSLIIFGIHLGLLGYLIYRSGYIPKIIGILLVIDGLGWVITPLRPYLYPNAHLGFFFPMSFVELILPLWLVIRGWKIQEPTAQYGAAATSSNA